MSGENFIYTASNGNVIGVSGECIANNWKKNIDELTETLEAVKI